MNAKQSSVIGVKYNRGNTCPMQDVGSAWSPFANKTKARKSLTVVDLLGSGAFGSVHHAKY